jgi:hypothetical protein
MNLNFLKIKLPKIDYKNILRAEPKNMWNGFLWFLVLLAFLAVALDVWAYVYFSGEKDVPAEINTLRTRKLDGALERVNSKKSRLESLGSFTIEDPS